MKASRPLRKLRWKTVLIACLLAATFPVTALMSTALTAPTESPSTARFPTDPSVADAALEAPVVKINPTDEKYQDGKRTWQGIAGIERAENGRLWATWYGGPAEEAPGENENCMSVLYTSEDDGDTWTGPVVVVDPEHPVSSRDPMLWTDPDGRLWFFWLQSFYRDDGRYGVWAMYTDNPEDATPTWSEPKRLVNGVALNKPIVLSDGTWMLPAIIWKGSGTTEFEDEVDCNVYISKDKGETWTYQGSVRHYAAEEVNPETFHVSEHMVVEQKDGSLRMLIRSDIGIEESYSTDGGKTWTDAVDTELTNVCSRFYFGRLSSGNLLLIYNDPPNDGTARTHLTAAISTDDGKTWPYKLVLDERNVVAYPDAVEDENGNIYVIYDKGRWAEGEILMAKITEADIMAGELTTSGSKLKEMVNNNTRYVEPAKPTATNTWITFDSTCTWASNPKWFIVNPTDNGLDFQVVQAGAGPGSGSGFNKWLTVDNKQADGTNEVDAIRFYIKNPGDANTVRLQFRDSLMNIWHSPAISVPGYMDDFVAIDVSLDDFTYRWSDAGQASEPVARGSSFKAAKEAGKLTSEMYKLDNFTFVFANATTADMTLKSLSAISWTLEQPEGGDPGLVEPTEPVNNWITFDSTCSWASNNRYHILTPTDNGLEFQIVTTGGGPHSGTGFNKWFTVDGKEADGTNEATLIRCYLKNPGSANTLRLQFADIEGNIWHSPAITVAGDSNEFVNYEVRLDDFTYRWGAQGKGKIVVDGTAKDLAEHTTWATAVEAGILSTNQYHVDVFQLVLNATDENMVMQKIEVTTAA